MSEKTDYQMLKKHMPNVMDRLDRIENVVGVGTPDVNYCIDGVDGWIEMKSPKEPVRPTSKLFKFKNNHSLNQDQMNWFLRQRNADGRAFILICTNKRWMLVEGEHADRINDMTAQEICNIACWSLPKPISVGGWLALRRVLRG